MNQAGETVHEGSTTGMGPGDTGMAFFGGFHAGPAVLSASTAVAFEMAFLSLAADIRENVDFSPYAPP